MPRARSGGGGAHLEKRSEELRYGLDVPAPEGALAPARRALEPAHVSAGAGDGDS